MASKVELSVVAKNQASSVLKQVGSDIRGLGKEADKSKGGLNNMFDVAGGNLLSGYIRSAVSAVAGLGKSFIGALADATTAAAGMNAQVSGIGAVLGLTTGELTKVKGLINELGVDPNLKVNAQEAADAIDMLARNGLTLDQILGGAARATVFLANATGGSFDTSANVATDTMAMFKIGADEMMTAVDGITSVTVASKFNLDDYRLALAQAGGVASALGVDFEDFNTTIAGTSASFASGSDAGTSYKTFLQRLVPQSNEASEAMAELGLYSFDSQKAMTQLQRMGVKPLTSDMNGLITQLMGAYAATNKVDVSTEKGLDAFNAWAKEVGFVQNSFYDANGSLKDMTEVSAILNKATADLTEEQKNQYLTTIFGSDAMRTAFGLAEKGTVVYTDVAKAAEELGVSQSDLAEYAQDGITAFEALQVTMRKTDALEAARKRVDNLAGDMEIFSGVVDSIRLQIGDKFDKPLRKLFQGLTPLASKLAPSLLNVADLLGQGMASAVGNLESINKAFIMPALNDFVQNLQNAKLMSNIALSITGDSFTATMAGLAEMFGGTVEIDTAAKVVSVDWLSGAFTHTYDALAQVSETSVGWGAWTHSYDALAKVESTSVLWGAWSHTYDAMARIDEQSVLWGAWTHIYDAKADVDEKSIGWGLATHTYDAKADITENSIAWGLASHTYDAKADIREEGVLWGLWTTTYDATGKIIKTEVDSDLPIPEIKANAKIEAYIEEEGANLNFAEKFALRFAPGVLEFLRTFAPAIKPPTQTEMGPLLTMTVPTLPADFWPTMPTFTWPTLPAWSWPSLPVISWPSLPTFSWPSLPVFTWPVLPRFAWPTLPTFSWPMLPIWAWPTLPTFSWPSLPSWSWPSLPSWSWPSLPSFTWPSLPTFTWPSLPSWSWPSIPMPSWVGWLTGGDSGDSPSFRSSGSIGGNAAGTDSWKGGLTWVGEKGPELLNLPKGSQILSNTESQKMIGQLADGTTTAPATGGNQRQGNVMTAISNAAAQFAQGGEKISKAFKQATKDLEASLKKVPGLFGSSPVTEQQMKLGELGVPQNFADDYLRRLTDEVVNGVDWENVDIGDAASRAGIDPSLPAEAILELFKQKWNDSSLFADPKNKELINMDAVEESLKQQAQAKLGQANLLSWFGVTPEALTAQSSAAGGSIGTGIATGASTALSASTVGTDLAGGLGTAVKPEMLAPVGGTIVDGIATEIVKKQHVERLGAALIKMFTTYLGNPKSFTSVGEGIIRNIAAQFGATKIDMVAKLMATIRTQLGTEAGIAALAAVGEKILDGVYKGYVGAAKNADWTAGVSGTKPEGGTTTNTAPAVVAPVTTTPGNLTPRSLALVGAGNIYITNYFTVNNAMDVQEVAAKVVDVIRRRR